MGHRANLVLLEASTYRLFYCHWCANTLTRDLFWGPTFAKHFVSNQVEIQPNNWLDTSWAEGVVLLDPHQLVLLFFGGERILVDIPLRRLYLSLLQEVWTGWSIRWAHQGLFDIMDYLSLPQSTVAAPWTPDMIGNEWLLDAPDDIAWLNTVGSIVFEDNSLRLFPLLGEPFLHLEQGPRIIDAARHKPGLEQLHLVYWTDDLPTGGFHVDLRTKQLSFWAAKSLRVEHDIAHHWPGWDIYNLGDAFEQHLIKTNGLLTFNVRPVDTLVAQLRQHLLGSPNPDNPNYVRQLAERLRGEDNDVQINAFALREDPLIVPFSLREAIFEAALTAWKQRQAPQSSECV